MKLCLSSQSVDKKFLDGTMDLLKFIYYCAELNLSLVELEDKHFAATDVGYLTQLKEFMNKKGIQCANIAFDSSFGYPTSEQNAEEIVRAEKWMDIAITLNCPNFRLFAGWMGGLDQEIGKKGPAVEKTSEAWNEMVGCMQKTCAIAKKKGLNIVIENHNHGGFLSSSDDVLKLFAKLDMEVVSLLLDTGNYVDGFAGMVRTVAMATKHIHLKLNSINEDGLDDLYDLPSILALIKSAGFSGALSMEYEGVQEEFDVLPKVVKYLENAIL